MKHTEFNYTASDGMASYMQIWQPDEDSATKAVICLIHGLGEHSSRYAHFARFMTAKGIAVMATDLRGHGKSEGRRGDVADYGILGDQVAQVLARAKQVFATPNIFLYGHSMGGNIVLNYALREQPLVNGLIISAPFLRTPDPIPAAKLLLARIMKNVWGGWRENNALKIDKLSHLPEVETAYRNDALVHPQISVRWFYGAIQAAEHALNHAADLKIPTLLMHDTKDALTAHDASAEFAQKNPQFVTFKSWQGLYHELHNETQQNEGLQLVANGINEQGK